MNEQADRAGGDGLSREQIIEYIRELNTIAAECEIAGTVELSRAAHNLYRIAKQWFKSLPIRDGAEGAANNSDGLCPVPPARTSAVSTQTACEIEGVSSDLSAAARRMSDGVGSLAPVIAASQCENGVSPGPSETAPPKPAPDSGWSYLDIAKHAGPAPVASPDGAGAKVTRESIAQELVLYERWNILDEATRAMIHRAISFILNFPPSPAVAAEPGKSVDDIAREITEEIRCEEEARKRVALLPDVGDIALMKVLLQVLDNQNAALKEFTASPPVRGDRKAIAKLQEIVDLDSHGRYGRLAREAIAILALPTQSPERETAIRECIVAAGLCAEVSTPGGMRSAIISDLRGLLVQLGAGERDDAALLDWLNEQPVDVIYLDDGFLIDVKGNDVRQALKVARDEQASRQPHSSREGGR